MKSITALFERRSPVPDQHIPASRLGRVNQAHRRRLSDAVEDVFVRACIDNDLRTAAGLFLLLDDLFTRRCKDHGQERRINDDALVQARAQLERCRELNARPHEAA